MRAMHANYINLDAATERRSEIEACFQRVAHQGWELSRFRAVTAAEMIDAPGSLPPAEKACFESHRRLIGQSLGDEQSVYVLEDDVAFSDKLFPFLSAFGTWDGDWDLLFTEVTIARATDMVRVALERERLAQRSQATTYPLEGIGFLGAMGYLVRGGFKATLQAMLMEAERLDAPYDLYLNQLASEGRVKAMVCLPYLTTDTAASAQSQIGGARLPLQVRAFDAFRRLMYVDRDLETCRREAADIRQQTPELQQILGALIGGVAARPA
jgi:GR25 family glycosyltransferase involved in LPS biosynthesis